MSLTINGIINVNKPKGYTSFAIVASIKRWSRERRVGHAGTLDPQATGVLPVCLGQATRLVEFLHEGKKIYQAAIEFGVTTDSYDITGNVVSRSDSSSLTREKIESAIEGVCGCIEQLPPPLCALKHQGRPLYSWARAGIEVPRKKRNVELSRIEVLYWEPPVICLTIECSKGTYIRSLAHDLGQMLGCGACLRDLIRLKNGPFNIEDSENISRVEEALLTGNYDDVIQPLDKAVLHLPMTIVDNKTEEVIVNGCYVSLSEREQIFGDWCRAYSREGVLIAMLHYDGEKQLWHPRKVFAKSKR